MGSSTSKAARTASSTVRKYPSRVPPPTSKPSPASPSTSASATSPTPAPDPAQPDPTTTSSSSSFSPSQDSALAARMLKLGPVQPTNPNTGFSFPPSQSMFPSPASNPAVTLLSARAKLAASAEAELEEVARQGVGKKGREFLDVGTVRTVLRMRDEMGMGEAEIEGELGLRQGLVGRLGRRGVVGAS